MAAQNDAEQFLVDRLGPLARRVVHKSPRLLNVAAILKDFQNRREPIEVDGEFYPAPAYNSPDGDAELAGFIERHIRQFTGMTIEEATPEVVRRLPPAVARRHGLKYTQD